MGCLLSAFCQPYDHALGTGSFSNTVCPPVANKMHCPQVVNADAAGPLL